MPATILHPTDFSDNSQFAFRTACSLARDRQAKLVLLYVVPPATAPLIDVPPPNPLVAAESQESCRGTYVWPVPSEPGVQVEHRVAEGDAPDEIVRLARSENCELIVVGTHGRSGLGRFLMGSVAEEVLRKAHCPVLVVKPPLPERPQAQAAPKPGEMIDVRPLGAGRPVEFRKSTLFKGDNVALLMLSVPAGKEIAEHKAKGEIIVHCLKGCVAFGAFGQTQDLAAGQLIHLPAGQPHRLKGRDDAWLLVTMIAPRN
jgi:nucleotide-binding universal stress UspA family protein/quercetin dioxygenase-like cupin family protein